METHQRKQNVRSRKAASGNASKHVSKSNRKDKSKPLSKKALQPELKELHTLQAKTGLKPAVGGKKRGAVKHLKRDDLERMIQERTSELRTHQIELEMQNEELRAAQLELEASRVKYANLYEFAPIAYFTFNAKGLIQEANVTAANQLGISKERLLNKPFSLFIHGSDGRLVFAAHRKETCLTQERHTCELRLRRVDGTFFHAQLESIAVDNMDGKAGHIRTAVTDITERKRADEVLRKDKDELERHVQLRTSELAETITALTSEITDRKRAEKELNESRENLKKAQAIAHIGSWSFDLGSRQVTWSRELFRIFGIAPGTIDPDLENVIPRFVHPGDRQKVRQAYRQMVKTSKANPLECRVILPDGRKRIVWAEAEMARDSLGKPVSIIGTVQDITDRKRAEEELIRLATALESAADAVVITDSARGAIQYVNTAFEKMTGYARDEVLGRDLHMLDSDRHDETFYEQLRDTLREEGFWSGRLIQKRKDETLYEEECTYSPVRNASGEIINYISIKRDVTEKVRLESIAQAVDTMKNIGYIFAGVSHEIGTPINTIGMNLDMISKKMDTLTKENIAVYVERAQSQVSRVLYLLRNLKNFNMYESTQSSAIDVPSFLEGFLSMVKEDFEKKGISIEAVLEQGARSVHADPRALQQVLLNIFTNAFDALEGRDDPKIVIAVAPGTDGLVKIRVTDNGHGMEETTLKDLFKPFYTTKKHGTGLGLVIIKKMVSRMNGTVEMTSRLNEGTAVEICLPSI